MEIILDIYKLNWAQLLFLAVSAYMALHELIEACLMVTNWWIDRWFDPAIDPAIELGHMNGHRIVSPDSTNGTMGTDV